MKLDIIFESDSENFLKNDILRIICATVCRINYAVYFQISVKINEYDIKIIIDSGATGNFISPRIFKIFKIFKQRKASSIELRIINNTFIF